MRDKDALEKGAVERKESKALHLRDLLDTITEIKENYAENFDIFEAVDDHLEEIFQCDLNCATCSNLERANCMQRFKQGNIYWAAKVREWESVIYELIDDMRKFVVNLAESMEDIVIRAKEELEEDIQEMKKELEIKSTKDNGLYV